MYDYQALTDSIVEGQRDDAKRLTQEALDAGQGPMDIVDHGLVPGMAIIGEKFKCSEVYVPEMLIASRAMKEAMTLLEPLLAAQGIEPDHTIVIGTVIGDLHDIGKNLVAMMLKGANYKVIDLGTNVSPDTFIEAVKEHNADVLGLSALLTTTMPEMQNVIALARESGLDQVRIIVGGAPVTQSFAEQINADGYAADAATAVEVVEQVLAA